MIKKNNSFICILLFFSVNMVLEILVTPCFSYNANLADVLILDDDLSMDILFGSKSFNNSFIRVSPDNNADMRITGSVQLIGLVTLPGTAVNTISGSPVVINAAGQLGVGAGGGGGSGLLTTFAQFYALMPGDNSATVAVGAAVNFPNDGPTSGAGIARLSASTFQLSAIGTYEVTWQVSVDEAGQLDLWLDSGVGAVEQSQTVVGRATGTNQLMGNTLITTTAVNSILSVRNPSGNSTALTITPIAGGTHPVSALLTIKRIA